MTATSPNEGINKVWQFFRSSFTDRPNPEHGAGLTAFRAEWAELSSDDKAQIREGLQNGTHTY